jgi:hypothetical protein
LVQWMPRAPFAASDIAFAPKWAAGLASGRRHARMAGNLARNGTSIKLAGRAFRLIQRC